MVVGAILVKKCAKCKKAIEIDVDDIKGVMHFEGLYYHDSCLQELAFKRATNKRYAAKWQAVLDDNFEIINCFKKKINSI